MIFSEPRLGDMSDSHRVPPDGWDQMAPIRKKCFRHLLCKRGARASQKPRARGARAEAFVGAIGARALRLLKK